jgi:hypothetical protein
LCGAEIPDGVLPFKSNMTLCLLVK